MATNVLTNINLTDNQKQVLVKIQAAATPLMGGREARNGTQYIEATKILIDLGLITYANDEATVTDAGRNAMRQENLIDDADQLTPHGQQQQQVKPNGVLTAPPPDAQAPSPQKPEDEDPFASPDEDPFAAPGGDENPFESFNLLKDLMKRSYFKK